MTYTWRHRRTKDKRRGRDISSRESDISLVTASKRDASHNKLLFFRVFELDRSNQSIRRRRWENFSVIGIYSQVRKKRNNKLYRNKNKLDTTNHDYFLLLDKRLRDDSLWMISHEQKVFGNLLENQNCLWNVDI